MNNWLQQLRQRLSSTKAVIQSSEGASIVDLQNQGGLWIVGRDCCVFRKVDVALVPEAKVEQALQNQVSVNSPYQEPGFWFVVENSIASVWIWDEAHRKKLGSECGIDTDEFVVLPESCFTSIRAGLVLYEGLGSGFYVQSRSESGSFSEMWWPTLPSLQAWRVFSRSIGEKASDIPEAQPLDISALEPWPSVHLNAIPQRSLERMVWRITLIGFLLVFGFQLSNTIGYSLQQRGLEAKIEELKAEYRESLELRDEAHELRMQVLRLLALAGDPQLRLLGKVAQVLPNSSGDLLSWKSGNESLEFVVVDASPDLEDYVRRVESLPEIQTVSVERDQSGRIKVLAEMK